MADGLGQSSTRERMVCVHAASVVSDSVRPQEPPGSSVHGVFQARILEWVAVSYSRGSSRDQTCVSCVSSISRRILLPWRYH